MREPDFSLSATELREVTAFALAAAIPVLRIYEETNDADDRPRRAIDAAREFVDGAARSQLQRLTAPAAHRAAKAAPSAAARYAAMAAGDAAASAYLHPLADVTQVGHILRASAHAALASDLAEGEPSLADSIRIAVDNATPVLIDVLLRYPPTPATSSNRIGSNRIGDVVHRLDVQLRTRAVDG